MPLPKPFIRIQFTFFLAFLAVAPLASGQGTIQGTVVDATGGSVARAEIQLSVDGRAPDQVTRTAESGAFVFSNVPPGIYRISFKAPGFALKTVDCQLSSGETLNLPRTVLTVESLTAAVDVTQTQPEIAEAQVKAEETQRLLGLLPNFFTSYDLDAAPLNTKQKLELTARTWLDPSSFVVNGIIAGVQQADNTHKGFGQGAQGYAKRYGASFADYGTELLLEKVVSTTVFRQDPRYFYKGTGTTGSRLRYALSRTFVCRGDNRKDQFCYSTFFERFGAGFVTNYYFPARDRDSAGTILRNATFGIGFDAIGNVFQEFFARKITRRKP